MDLRNGFDIKRYIRTIPDYPKPGIMFRDITTLLLDPAGFARSDARRRYMRLKSERLVSIWSDARLLNSPGLTVSFPHRSRSFVEKSRMPTLAPVFTSPSSCDVPSEHTPQPEPGPVIWIVISAP